MRRSLVSISWFGSSGGGLPRRPGLKSQGRFFSLPGNPNLPEITTVDHSGSTPHDSEPITSLRPSEPPSIQVEWYDNWFVFLMGRTYTDRPARQRSTMERPPTARRSQRGETKWQVTESSKSPTQTSTRMF